MKTKYLSILVFLVHLLKFGYGISRWKEHSPPYEILAKSKIQSRSLGIDENTCEERYGNICPPAGPSTLPLWANVPFKPNHDNLFRRTFDIILNKVIFQNEPAKRCLSPFDFKSPEHILQNFDFNLGSKGEDLKNLEGYMEKIVEYSPKVSHPYYLDKHQSGLDPYGLVADWTITTVASPVLTYLFGPVSTFAEMEVARVFYRLIGYGNGDFAFNQFPNGFAISHALQNRYNNFKREGHVKAGRPQVSIFVSDQADYSWEKFAVFEGVGSDGIIRVKSDKYGRMNIQALEKAISECKAANKVPLMIVATAGTPILGAIDDCHTLGKIAMEHQMWFHVDGTLAGAVLFSDKKRDLLKGIDMTDSVTIGLQGLLNAPVEGGLYLTRYPDSMYQKFGIHSAAVIHTTTILNDPKWDIGDHTFHTSRRTDGYKMWYMWKAKGTHGLGCHIDHIYKNAKFATEEIAKRQGFKLILNSFDTPLISFYYIHPSLRKANNTCHLYMVAMNEIAEILKNKLLTDGVMQITLTQSTLKNVPNFFTMKLSNSALRKQDITIILDSIEKCGEQILNQDCHCKRTQCLQDEAKKYPNWISSPIESQHKEFYKKAIEQMLAKGLYFQDKRNQAIYKFVTPEDLPNHINFTLGSEGLGHEELLNILDKTLEYTPHFAHPYWMYQLFAGLDPYTIVAELLSVSLSTPLVTYEDNPIFNVMEQEVGKAVRGLFGKGWEDSDVIFPYGGTMGNTMAIYLARHRHSPHLKKKGISSQDKTFRVYINRDAHYSLTKASYFTGLGYENSVFIEPDEFDRMNITALTMQIEKDLSEGIYTPLIIAASAGHTVVGAVDEIDRIADVAEKYKLWLHVDGTFGGVFILSENEEKRAKLKGYERADSFTFNPTKLLGATVLLTCFTVKTPGIIQEAMQIESPIDYTDRTKLYDSKEWDKGDNYLETIRSAKVLKMFMLWKAKGRDGITKHLDYVYSNALYILAEIKKRPNFETFLEKFDLTNVLFMYVPDRIKNLDRKSEKFITEIEKVSFGIQAKLVLDGILLVVAQRILHDTPLMMKIVSMNSSLSKEDIDYIIRQIERYGKEY